MLFGRVVAKLQFYDRTPRMCRRFAGSLPFDPIQHVQLRRRLKCSLGASIAWATREVADAAGLIARKAPAI
jgi:hypothetical protein